MAVDARQAAQPQITFALAPAGVRETVDLVTLGEELGFDAVWIADQGYGPDPFVPLALAAQATSQIELGVGVTSPFTRLPLQIARCAATLDEVSDGRFRLGLGTGNVDHVLRPLGVDYVRPAQRVAEAVQIIRGLWAGDTVSFDGVADHLAGARLDFDVPRTIPIYIGARRPQMLALAGRMADGVLVESLFNGDGPGYVTEKIRAGAAERGPDLGQIDVVAWQVVVVTDDAKAEIDRRRAWAVRTIQNGPADALELIGVGEGVYDAVVAAKARGDDRGALAAVSDDDVRALMAIGGPEEIADRLQSSLERGATSVNVLWIGASDGIAPNLRRFAETVTPLFRTVG
ncbi:MAG TPA: LLM class flavin-dependent oxidoreductase [Solirubrobacteraceae bacterium]|jgi:alkanesulfonate monooxygenase SsuD/methylene tetrahydromethanopterin reductase-like flavin-dependent oxidoreductase (luciferase family)|nr:LLM class flavin-dependent oxidoreductase [Solirubrobacteraceae bacterium]